MSALLRLVSLCLIFAISPAQATIIETLNGRKINATSVSEVKSQKNGTTYTGDFFATYDLSISGNKVNGTIGGYFIFSGNRSMTFSKSVSGEIGLVKRGPESEHLLWALQGQTITLLRLFQDLGMVMRVNFSGNARCAVMSSIAKPVGGGPTIVPSAYGGTTELLSVKLKTSNCTIK